jgi:hypothetical protein
MDHREFMSHFEAEARRLRLNMFRLTGLAASGSGWEERILAHMRSLQPECTWADVFPGPPLPEPPPEMHDQVAAADADPEVYWRWAERNAALWREMRRVFSAEIAEANRVRSGFGMSFPHGPDHALRVFRSLPDGAGAKVAWTALTSIPPDE